MNAADRVVDPLFSLLSEVRDIVDERVRPGVAPTWAVARGWHEFLLGLDESVLRRAEREGPAAVLAEAPDAPAGLRELGGQVAELIRPYAAPAVPVPVHLPAVDRVGRRKVRQLTVLIDLLAPLLGQARRVVDVGSGRGHLARLCGEAWEREVLGLERDPARVAVARALARPTGERHEVRDLFREGLALEAHDLALGLHACGELGELILRAAVDAGAGVALISCCFQKIRGPTRPPLSRAAGRFGLVFRRPVLALANMTHRESTAEGTLDEVLASREVRLALELLLTARGLDPRRDKIMLATGRGLSYHGLPRLAAAAFSRRGLAPPTRAELDDAGERARIEFARIRRFSQPRTCWPVCWSSPWSGTARRSCASTATRPGWWWLSTRRPRRATCS